MLQHPSALQAHGGFSHGREESEAPSGRRGTGRNYSSPPRGERDTFPGAFCGPGELCPLAGKRLMLCFPFKAASPSTGRIPAERWGPTPALATESSGRSPLATAGSRRGTHVGGGSTLAAAPEAGNKY